MSGTKINLKGWTWSMPLLGGFLSLAIGSPIWTTNLPGPFVANGRNVVTNPIPGTQQFFRLSQ